MRLHLFAGRGPETACAPLCCKRALRRRGHLFANLCPEIACALLCCTRALMPSGHLLANLCPEIAWAPISWASVLRPHVSCSMDVCPANMARMCARAPVCCAGAVYSRLFLFADRVHVDHVCTCSQDGCHEIASTHAFMTGTILLYVPLFG